MTERGEFLSIHHTRLLIILILGFFCVYSAVFILRTTYVIEGKRYFMLFDDSMVSMQYAKNLVKGHGLVWNAGGERVEGYTNPLWVLYMTVFHLLDIHNSKISLFLQISGAVFLLLNLIFVLKIAAAISQNSAKVTLLAVLLTAFYFPLNNWSLQGTEVSVLTLLISICIYRGILYLQVKKSPFLIYLLLGAATMIRLDIAVILIATMIFFGVHERQARRMHLIAGISSLLFFLLLQTVFRYGYYGEFLPNTYYLKMTGFPLLFRISRGVFMFLWFAWHMNFVLFCIPFLVTAFNREKTTLLLCWMFIAQAIYSIFVGGDAWEPGGGANRYISIVMPIFFILFSFCIVKCLSWFQQNISQAFNLYVAFLIISFLSLIQFNSFNGPAALAHSLLIKRPFHVEDNYKMLRTGLLLKRITNENANIAVVWAGIIPYFSDRFAIDLLGKNDKKIARENMRIPTHNKLLEGNVIPLPPSIYKFIAFYPGHLKWNYGYSIGELNPDVIVGFYHSPAEAGPYVNGKYKLINVDDVPLYFRSDSENVDWSSLH